MHIFQVDFVFKKKNKRKREEKFVILFTDSNLDCRFVCDQRKACSF